MDKPTPEGRPEATGAGPHGGGGFLLGPLLVAVCDELATGLVVVDLDLRIHFANRRARQFIDSADCLLEQQGVLRLRDPQRQAEFEVSTRRAAGAAPGEEASRFVLRLDPVGPGPAGCLRGCRLALPEGPLFLFVISDPRSSRTVEPALLMSLFGLTRAEACVAARLFAGLSVEEVAHESGVSVSTVKTHLHHVFEKCEVGAQSELLQLLALDLVP